MLLLLDPTPLDGDLLCLLDPPLFSIFKGCLVTSPRPVSDPSVFFSGLAAETLRDAVAVAVILETLPGSSGSGICSDEELCDLASAPLLLLWKSIMNIQKYRKGAAVKLPGHQNTKMQRWHLHTFSNSWGCFSKMLTASWLDLMQHLLSAWWSTPCLQCHCLTTLIRIHPFDAKVVT